MFDGYTESAAQIEARKARILARHAPIYPPLPTLAECLEMHEDAELVRRHKIAQKWANFFAEIDELRAEVAQP